MKFLWNALPATMLVLFLGLIFCETTMPVEDELKKEGIDGRTYTNRELGFSIDRPEEWTMELSGEIFRETEGKLLVVMVSEDTSSEGFRPNANLVYQPNIQTDHCSDFYAQAQAEFFSAPATWQERADISDSLLSVTVDTTDSIKACRIVFTTTYHDTAAENDTTSDFKPIPLWIEQRFWILDDNLIVLTMLTPRELYTSTRKEYAEIIESINVFDAEK